jgi:hypothetical protein
LDQDLKFKTTDLVDTVVEHIGGPAPERLVRAIMWRDSPQVARTQMLLSIANDVRTAWRVLDKPADDDEYREAAEQALWLRKLAEHLVTLVNFTRETDLPDYWLWLSLMEHHEMQRLKRALSRELSFSPTPRQLRPIVRGRRTQTSAEILKAAEQYYGAGASKHRPWFVTEKQWHKMAAGELEAVERWHPPRMRDRMDAVRGFCHPVEITLLGHYQLTYGRYSSEIHAYQEADQLGARCEEEMLWLSVLAVLHRLAELTECEQRPVQLLIARVIESCSRYYRFAGPPITGEMVSIFGDREALVQVTELSRDAAIAVVTTESQVGLEVRRAIELVHQGF